MNQQYEHWALRFNTLGAKRRSSSVDQSIPRHQWVRYACQGEPCNLRTLPRGTSNEMTGDLARLARQSLERSVHFGLHAEDTREMQFEGSILANRCGSAWRIRHLKHFGTDNRSVHQHGTCVTSEAGSVKIRHATRKPRGAPAHIWDSIPVRSEVSQCCVAHTRQHPSSGFPKTFHHHRRHVVGSTTFQNSFSKRGGSSATALNLFVANICALTCPTVELFRNNFQKRQCPMVPGSICRRKVLTVKVRKRIQYTSNQDEIQWATQRRGLCNLLFWNNIVISIFITIAITFSGLGTSSCKSSGSDANVQQSKSRGDWLLVTHTTIMRTMNSHQQHHEGNE